MLPFGWSKRRKRGKGRVERDLCALMAGARPSFLSRPSTRHLGSTCFVFLVLFSVFYLLSPTSLPSSYSPDPEVRRLCSTTPFLDDHLYCTGECNTECFPRVRNICFASDRVRLCDREKPLSALPKFMRFFGEKLTVSVEEDAQCNEGWHWVQGFSLVLDQRFLPAGKPNPHHEAEKLIPALLLKQFLNRTANLQWFASKDDVSVWAMGLLMAFGLKVRFHNLPRDKDDSICFQDAVLFSGPTDVKYVPNEETNSWLRSQVLRYCHIKTRNASWPISRAVVLDRSSGPRQLANKLDAGTVMERTLLVPVEHRSGGIGRFCEQVRSVAEDDLFLIPHGSQNVNFLFARRGAVVVEVFPYLYHTDALRNFTHAVGIDVYPLLGARPPDGKWLRVASLLGWDVCFSLMWCKNFARQQPLQIDLGQLEKLLRVVQRQRSSLRKQLGW